MVLCYARKQNAFNQASVQDISREGMKISACVKDGKRITPMSMRTRKILHSSNVLLIAKAILNLLVEI